MSASIYRSLTAARRVALLTTIISSRKDSRALFIQRLVARGGGFRAATLMTWPAPKLAAEVVRMNAQTPDDEIDLLQALYVDVEPAIQEAFLKAAGVKAEGAVIDEALEPPYAAAEAVAKAAALVHQQFGEDGMHYLRTIARYNPSAWPGIVEVVEGMGAGTSA